MRLASFFRFHPCVCWLYLYSFSFADSNLRSLWHIASALLFLFPWQYFGSYFKRQLFSFIKFQRKHLTILTDFIFLCPFIVNVILNYNQQDATFLDLFIPTDALQVSGGSSAHHQEHIAVHTAAGIVNNTAADCSQKQYWLTIPEAVCTVMCSWWWAEEAPETCTASVGINKSRNVASCWL